MPRDRLHLLFINVGHFYDHLFMLLFATVAALTLSRDWGMTYGELIPYATPGFIAFGVCALPAGWLADKWSREGMMAAFFIGVGACSILTGFADTPIQIGAGLLAIGVFGAIYHPVGIAMVVETRGKVGMAVAVNGVFGNIGVGSAALIAGLLIDVAGWRAAFIAPGIVSLVTGLAYMALFADRLRAIGTLAATGTKPRPSAAANLDQGALVRVFAIILVTTAIGGLIFQSTTFALPKVFDERLTDLGASATMIGGYAFLVFAAAAVAQLVVGFMVDRYSIRTVFTVVAAMQVVFLGLMIGTSGWLAIVVAVAFMLAVFGQIPINDVLIGRVTTKEWRSRVYSVRYIVTFSVMASAVPLIGWIHNGWGFDTLFGVLALSAMGILAAVLMLPRTRAVTGKAARAVAAAD
jgi:MFS family permease